MEKWFLLPRFAASSGSNSSSFSFTLRLLFVILRGTLIHGCNDLSCFEKNLIYYFFFLKWMNKYLICKITVIPLLTTST